MSEMLYIQFSEDGQHIRKWSRDRFAEGVQYAPVIEDPNGFAQPAGEGEVERLRATLAQIALNDWYTTRRRPNPNGGIRGYGGHIAASVLTGRNGSMVSDADVRLALQRRSEEG